MRAPGHLIQQINKVKNDQTITIKLKKSFYFMFKQLNHIWIICLQFLNIDFNIALTLIHNESDSLINESNIKSIVHKSYSFLLSIDCKFWSNVFQMKSNLISYSWEMNE